MNSINQNQTGETEKNGLELIGDSISNLNETRKWTKFLAILGFVSIGLTVLLGFIGTIVMIAGGGLFNTLIPSFWYAFMYLVLGVIYLFPILYLYRFSTWTEKAILNNNKNNLNAAFRNLKAHYRFMGIMMIIMLGIFAVASIITIAGASLLF